MPTPSADRDDSHAAVAGAAQFLRHIAAQPRAMAALLLAFSLLALVGTQLAQADAPTTVPDGLARADLLLLLAVGLDRLPSSVLTWLLLALSAVAALAHALFPEDGVRWRGTLLAIDEAQPAIQAALAKLELRATPVWHRRGDAIAMTLGFPRAGRVLLAASGLLLGVHLILSAAVPLPALLDVPLGAAPGPVPTWTPDAGVLAPAQGRWYGACAREGDGVRCHLDTPGARQDLRLRAGESTVIQGLRYTWLATGRTAAMSTFALRWPPGAQTTPLTVVQSLPVPQLGLRLLPTASREAGPLVLALGDTNKSQPLQILAAPVLLPQGHLAATVTGGEVLRIQVARDRPAWPLWIALLCAALGALLAWALPCLRLQIRPGLPAAIEVDACNRPSLLAAVQGAAQGQGEVPP